MIIHCGIFNFRNPWQIFVALYFCLITLFSSSALAQSNKDAFRIKQFTLEDGLSQVSTNDLLLDKFGFVWIATQDGLNRFDGNEFKYFKHSESDSTTISGNLTNKLLEDNNGDIWVGTIGNGLNKYDINKAVFRRIKLENTSDHNEIISGLAQDSNGGIWVASRISGLHRLEYNDDTYEQTSYLHNQPLSALLYDQHGSLWVGGFEGSIYKFDLKNKETFQNSTEIRVKGNVQSLYNTGRHLLIGSDYGFFIYDFKTKKTDLIELEESGLFKTKHVLAFLQQDSETVWIATGNGLYLFDWNQKKVLNKIQYLGNDNNGLSNNTVQALQKLSNNELLVGTANYLNLVDFSQSYFNNISKDKRGKHLLNDNVIFSIFKDGEDLWVGTSDGGLNLIRNDKVYYLTGDENNPTSISGSVVRAIIKDEKNQRMWLATTRGLNLLDLNDFNPNNPKFVTFHHDPENINTINGDFLKDLALDKENNLWGATYGHGVFRLEMDSNKTTKIIRYRNERSNQNSLKNDFAACIRVDKENNILIGTQGGLSKLSFTNGNYENPKFENFFRNADSKKAMSHNSVYDVVIDKKERVWVATRHGLNLFLGNNEFESWTVQDQFPNAVVYSIQDDNYGNLWLGTNDGLIKFNPESEKFSQYNLADGIQSKEFDIHAKFKDVDGVIYMGGIGGLTYFHPEDLISVDNPKPLYFSQLKIKDKIVKPSNSNNVLSNLLFQTKELEFKQKQFPFYLQFSAIDYRLQKNIAYGYKLLPNDEWNMLATTEIQFLNLPSGDYTLQVNGFSRGKQWNQPPLEMTLKILPPPWATWWAYALYALILGSLSYLFYSFQLSKKLAVAERNKLKDLNTLKSNLYTNITHEFRTPLTVILGLADTIKDDLKVQDYKTANEGMGIIERNGKDLLQLVNQLLGLSKAESGTMELNLIHADIVPFLRYICESFQSLAKTSNIDITMYFETESFNMDFDDGKLQIIISNLLSNAIKYSPDGERIIFHVKNGTINEDECIIIKVKDYGVGIPEKALPHIFDRFYQVENSFSKVGKGTGIGLALTKELVMLMKGAIVVKSIERKGTEFTVTIPITRNASTTTKILTADSVNFVEDVNEEEEWSLQLFDNDVNLPKALIIEDNKDVAYYLKLCLQNKYHCLFANNGDLGLEMAFEKIPDVILSDIMMPGRNGFEVCEILKTDERTDHIPVIMLTAKTSGKDRLKGLQHGADAYLTKPFLKAELLTRLDQLILLRKRISQALAKNKFSQILESKDATPETKFLQKVILVIQNNIDNPNLGSRHVAQKMQLSESQIYRKLKAITGKSTAVFIRSVRLEKAKDLIQTTDKSISEIAYQVGFNDPSWFSRAFKEEFGHTPSAIHK
ncbi:MAG: two-component regulator propeller domain-containing protein [Psychroserpens sp.]|uniref:hybrid sensor histidine kinase/response regulator transcription factor n=1 Tax=Psychroserpens sp. TaxID=2020870 RepID=UPI0030019633